MDPRLFLETPMGLDKVRTTLLSERLVFDEDRQTMFVDFEGLSLPNMATFEALEAQLTEVFEKLPGRVKVVVNYENFTVAPAVEKAYFAMVERNTERYFSSVARYSSDAFFRRKTGDHSPPPAARN